MDWNTIFDLIHSEFMIVVVACWVIGYALKMTPRVRDWTIIYIVTLVAILLTGWMLGFSAESVVQGILCGAFAVYGHQLVKQSQKRCSGK